MRASLSLTTILELVVCGKQNHFVSASELSWSGGKISEPSLCGVTVVFGLLLLLSRLDSDGQASSMRWRSCGEEGRRRLYLYMPYLLSCETYFLRLVCHLMSKNQIAKFRSPWSTHDGANLCFVCIVSMTSRSGIDSSRAQMAPLWFSRSEEDVLGFTPPTEWRKRPPFQSVAARSRNRNI